MASDRYSHSLLTIPGSRAHHLEADHGDSPPEAPPNIHQYLNAALSAQVSATQANDVPTLISLQQKIKFNGGGHINHSLFWKNLTPPGTPGNELASAAPALRDAINSRWGSPDGFTKAFNAELLGIQGSGWGWLVSKGGPKGRLEITTTKDQDPVSSSDVPIFGVDMWEHAYYLQVSSY